MSHSNKSLAAGLVGSASFGAVASPSLLSSHSVQSHPQSRSQTHAQQAAPYEYSSHPELPTPKTIPSESPSSLAHRPPSSAASAMSGIETPKKGPDFPINIQLQQATPTTAAQPLSSSSVPGTLQPGGPSARRPSTTATNTYSAPQTVPTMPPPNQQQYTPRPPTLNTQHPQHSHSRSSPAGMDQKYIPFSTTPTKAFTPVSSHSPLGLADIRPRAGSDILNRSGMHSGAVYDYGPSQTNCSYMAPWAAYSFDWCKWPVQNGNSCGKMAIGSYLEDPHNFVSRASHPTRLLIALTKSPDPNC